MSSACDQQFSLTRNEHLKESSVDARKIYEGSDGEATKAMYAELQQLGARGLLAINLFRAQKTSTRAKVYRGGNGRGSYKRQAYDKKNWSLMNLCEVLGQELTGQLGIKWGWKLDDKQLYYPWVLYVDLPTGQASFHAEKRGIGPDYSGEWDGKHTSAQAIIDYVQNLLDNLDPRESVASQNLTRADATT